MTLGELCKGYEKDYQRYLDKDKPVIIRLDGRGFSKLTRKMEKPVCNVFQKTMQDTLRYLLENIQGTIVGYQQSDEITIVIDGYSKEDTQLFFGGRTDKILSTTASMATWFFNRKFKENIDISYLEMEANDRKRAEYLYWLADYAESYDFKAMFDSRVFQCEIHEISKMLKWRQMDMAKNSVTGYAQRYFSHKELQGVNTQTRKQMLLEKGFVWENEDFVNKYGYVLSLKNSSDNRQKFVKTDILFDKNLDIYEYVEKRTSFEK